MRSSRAIQLATLYCDVPSRNIASGLRFDVRFDSRHLFYISFQLRWTSHAEASRVSFQVSVQMLLTAGSAFRSARYARPITHAISKLSYHKNIECNATLPTLEIRFTVRLDCAGRRVFFFTSNVCLNVWLNECVIVCV